MTIVSIKSEKPEKRGNITRHAPFLAPANDQQNLAYVMALMEATRERKLAVLRISKLTEKAVDALLHLAERATYS